jgi:hypothetical protein
MKGLRLGSLYFERSWAFVNTHVPKVLPTVVVVDTLSSTQIGQPQGTRDPDLLATMGSAEGLIVEIKSGIRPKHISPLSIATQMGPSMTLGSQMGSRAPRIGFIL